MRKKSGICEFTQNSNISERSSISCGTQNTHVSNMDVHVVAAIDGFTSIYSNLNSEQSLEFLNWVKENVNGEVTLLSICIIYIDLDYKSQRKRI